MSDGASEKPTARYRVLVRPLSIELTRRYRDLAALVWPSHAPEYDRDTAIYLAHPAAFNPTHIGVQSGSGQPVGQTLIASALCDSNLLAVTWVMVHPAWRRSGIGRAMMRRCVECLESRRTMAFLTTSTPEFYRAIGFGKETSLADGRSLFLAGAVEVARRPCPDEAG